MRTKCICHFPIITRVRKEGVRKQKEEVEEGGSRREERKDRVREGGRREGEQLPACWAPRAQSPMFLKLTLSHEKRSGCIGYVSDFTRKIDLYFLDTLYKQNRKQTKKKLGNSQ